MVGGLTLGIIESYSALFFGRNIPSPSRYPVDPAADVPPDRIMGRRGYQ
jgi:hypothetical protein